MLLLKASAVIGPTPGTLIRRAGPDRPRPGPSRPRDEALICPRGPPRGHERRQDRSQRRLLGQSAVRRTTRLAGVVALPMRRPNSFSRPRSWFTIARCARMSCQHLEPGPVEMRGAVLDMDPLEPARAGEVRQPLGIVRVALVCRAPSGRPWRGARRCTPPASRAGSARDRETPRARPSPAPRARAPAHAFFSVKASASGSVAQAPRHRMPALAVHYAEMRGLVAHIQSCIERHG